MMAAQVISTTRRSSRLAMLTVSILTARYRLSIFHPKEPAQMERFASAIGNSQIAKATGSATGMRAAGNATRCGQAVGSSSLYSLLVPQRQAIALAKARVLWIRYQTITSVEPR